MLRARELVARPRLISALFGTLALTPHSQRTETSVSSNCSNSPAVLLRLFTDNYPDVYIY